MQAAVAAYMQYLLTLTPAQLGLLANQMVPQQQPVGIRACQLQQFPMCFSAQAIRLLQTSACCSTRNCGSFLWQLARIWNALHAAQTSYEVGGNAFALGNSLAFELD